MEDGTLFYLWHKLTKRQIHKALVVADVFFKYKRLLSSWKCLRIQTGICGGIESSL